LRLLLTGATGFIGSHVARRLVRDGRDEVYALVRPGSDTWRLVDVLPALRVLRADLTDENELARVLARVEPEVCLHLAWYANPSDYLVSPENITMLRSSLTLVTRLADSGCRRFVGAGTCLEYDVTAPVGRSEPTAGGGLAESDPTRPRCLYAATKLSLRLILAGMASAGRLGMDWAWMRFFHLYGPFEEPGRLVPQVILNLLRGRTVRATPGDQVRDYLHVEDVAAAVVAVMRSNLVGDANIASGRPVTVAEIVTSLGEIAGRPDLIALGALPHRPGDPMRLLGDNTRLVDKTGWAPHYNLREGLAQTAEWWRSRLAGAGNRGTGEAAPERGGSAPKAKGTAPERRHRRELTRGREGSVSR